MLDAASLHHNGGLCQRQHITYPFPRLMKAPSLGSLAIEVIVFIRRKVLEWPRLLVLLAAGSCLHRPT